MINDLIAAILQVDLTTGKSAVLSDSDGNLMRVYHARIWQGNQKSDVVFSMLGQSPDYAKGGMKLQSYDVTFTVYHVEDVEADRIADQLIENLEGYKGESGGKVWEYTEFIRKTQGFGDSQQVYAYVVDFRFARQN